MSLGYSLNSTNPAEIDAAVSEVLKWRRNARKFDAESYKTEVAAGSIWIGHGYSTDATQVIVGDEEEGMEPREDIGFALPKEGFTIAFDELVVAKDAKRKDLAYAFINFIYDGEAAKVNMEYLCGPNPVKPGIDLLDDEMRGIVLLDPETLKCGQVLKSIRRTSTIPVIMVTAKDETFDKVLGLELGADDYITKPFETKEMVARVKAVLRRTHGAEEDTDDTLSFPGLTVSRTQYECRYEGEKVEMPPKELEVLYFLASHAGQVFTRDQLLEQVWGFDFAGDSSRTVDVHIKRLREKLPDSEKYGWRIHTVWGVGYKFEVK